MRVAPSPRVPREALTHSAMWGHCDKTSVHPRSRKLALTQHWTWKHKDLVLPTFRMVRSKFLVLISYPAHRLLLQQSRQNVTARVPLQSNPSLSPDRGPPSWGCHFSLPCSSFTFSYICICTWFIFTQAYNNFIYMESHCIYPFVTVFCSDYFWTFIHYPGHSF
jgi:hypothetical protein